MKTILTTSAALIFSVLFYKQAFGLNVFLFAVLLVLFVLYQNKQRFDKQQIFNGILLITMAFLGFFYQNTLTAYAIIFSLLLFIGSVSNVRSSLIIKQFNGLFSIVAGAIMHRFEQIGKTETMQNNTKTNYGYWFKLVAISSLVLFVFMMLYRNANPIINNLISKINFDFINLRWLVFTASAYYFIANIARPTRIEPLTSTDLNTSNTLDNASNKVLPKQKIQEQNQLGIVLFSLLNILIIFVLLTDIIFVFRGDQLDAAQLSNQLHQGVNALIVAIVSAIFLILYFFKGNLNFYKSNKRLKQVTYLWIVLNILLTMSTWFKNYQYVSAFGLTYKRIGVFVYLILALSGLIFTFIKVFKIKNFWFLMRNNMRVAFVVLFISAFIPWDTLITNYNVKFIKDFDINYLVNLNHNKQILYEIKDTYPFERSTYNTIVKNYNDYKVAQTKNTWQAYTWDNVKVQFND